MSTAQIRPSATPVVYRAMWNDDRPGLHELAARSFRAWARSLHPQLGGGHHTSPEAPSPSQERQQSQPSTGGDGNGASDTRVNLRRETAAHGGVSETLLELDQHILEGSSLVVMRVLTNGSDSWIWVDVEMPGDRHGTVSGTGVQNLVCTLLDEAERGGGRPRLGNELLRTSADWAEPRRDFMVPFADRIRDPARRLPYVVIAYDPLGSPAKDVDVAVVTAQQLAGLARVFVLPAQSLNAFQVVMGEEWYVTPGEARLYLPGEHEPHRHRTLAPEFVRSGTDETGRWFGRLLQTMLVEREPPDLYRRSRQLLGDRRERYEPPPDFDAAERAAALEVEVEAVWDALYQARTERAAARAERDEQSDQLYGVLEELEGAQERIEQLQLLLDESRDEVSKLNAIVDRKVGELVAAGDAAMSPPLDASKRAYRQPTSVRDAIASARENLRKVEIPEGVEQHLEELDSALESRTWARSALDGLLALEAYAHSDDAAGDFREWCIRTKNPRKWPPSGKKLAMKESKEVMRQPELLKHRRFPVSTRVPDSTSGRLEMQAHLKLSNGSLAPRLYFHDDTRGTTGKVHVGYIGPHLPTKRFRS
ncbi:hypothetical protein [Candidatus Poriferisodalis sp.]|uniref:hypothetical protein n=1 Tax=Candidatus Poriferisodalis sp. TaxID=3101277 RepID=UPI003B5245E6